MHCGCEKRNDRKIQGRIFESKKKGTKCKQNTIKNIIKDVSKKRNVPSDCVTPDAIRRRVSRKSEFIEVHHSRGLSSPLLPIEPTILELILWMAKIRESLSTSQAIQLVNDVIQDTNHQHKLIQWKEKYCRTAEPTVGEGYWRGFMRRNEEKLVNTVGKKYDLARDKWSTYGNFKDMYEHIIHEMVEAKVAVKLDEPMWQDREGNKVQEGDAFGCKVTHSIIEPDWCIVGDEVGGNLSMKGDGGRKKLLCARGNVPREKVSSTDRHFTLIGLTTLSGTPLMCIVVMKGKRVRPEVELGIDPFAEIVGEQGDANYVRNNTGKEKLLPGGPTCVFEGKEVPCFIRWSPSGSITAEILKEALQELDHLGIFARNNGKKPFLLLDGHGSRFEYQFLKYINNPLHEWCVCIGVPYGTALWQVGDAEEQNGIFKTKLAEAKKNLMNKKKFPSYLWNYRQLILFR